MLDHLDTLVLVSGRDTLVIGKTISATVVDVDRLHTWPISRRDTES